MPYPASATGTQSAVVPVNNQGVSQDDLTREKELATKVANAIVFEKAAYAAFKASMGRLKVSQISAVSVQDNVVTYFLTETSSVLTKVAPIPGGPKNPPVIKYSYFANANLTAQHWVHGVSNLGTAIGFNGIYDGDLTYGSLSGGLRSVTIRQTRPNMAAKQLGGAGGAIWSIDNTKTTARADTSPTDWNKYLKNAQGPSKTVVLTYAQMPTAGGQLLGSQNPVYVTNNYQTAPTSVTYSTSTATSYVHANDVQWANLLFNYWQAMVKYYNTQNAAWTAVKKSISDQRAARGKLSPLVQDNTKTDGSKHGSTSDDKKKVVKPNPLNSNGPTTVGNDTKPVVYNLPVPKTSYFKQSLNTGGLGDDVLVNGIDFPNRVHEAKGLWKGNAVLNKKKQIDHYEQQYSGAHKGMIQSYVVPGNFNGQSKFWDPNNSTSNGGFQGGLKTVNKRRFGFQFMYNPSTVAMHYAGAPQVDIGLEMSGADKIALIGSGVTSSTVTFNLLINRMNDMRTIDALIKNPSLWKSVYPHNSNHPDSPLDPDVTTMDVELKAIRDKGTMYDVEYLLRTLIGYQLPSQLRGNELTADIGYLGAYPVELHLGKNLRYLVTVDSFDINHTIFTKEMVPIFTNLSITCNRLPEFNKSLQDITFKKTTTVAASNTNDSGN